MRVLRGKSKRSLLWGHNIATWRRGAGYVTAKDFAEALEVSHSTVTRWEKGDTEPRLDMQYRIVEILRAPELDSIFPRMKRWGQ